MTIPAGQTGLEDIEDAIENLFLHENLGPFISLRLIQRLVKSNPSPAYISRISAVFSDNGEGVRGDMAAVVKAILLDEEARECSYQLDWQNSKLKEPLLRYTQVARLLDKEHPSDFYWNQSDDFLDKAGQDILAAPSVFNFFQFNQSPQGAIRNSGLVAPEFTLHDARTALGYVNAANEWTRRPGRILEIADRVLEQDDILWDQSELDALYEDGESFLNWMDLYLTAGRMSESTRAAIRYVIGEVGIEDNYYFQDRLWHGMYLALISAEYNVIR